MTTLQIRGKRTITLPANVRKKYELEEGKVLTVIDLGEGTILLKSMISQVNKLSRQIEKRLKEENVSLDDPLQALDEEHKTCYKKHYVKKVIQRTSIDAKIQDLSRQQGSDHR